MKKLLGISLVAILAASPFAANAEVTPNNKIATTSYVQGAYEAAVDAATDITGDLSNLATSFTDGDKANLVAAVNATKTIADSASAQAGSGDIAVVTGSHMDGDNEVQDYATNLTEAVNQLNESITTLNANALTADSITEGTDNGAISVNGTDVSVHGLGSAAFTDSTAYDAAGAASGVQTAIEGKLDDGASGYDIDAKSLKVQGTDVLTSGAPVSTSGNITVYTTWNGEDTSTVTVSSTGTATTPAPAAEGE